jgi:hypothetical protein
MTSSDNDLAPFAGFAIPQMNEHVAGRADGGQSLAVGRKNNGPAPTADLPGFRPSHGTPVPVGRSGIAFPLVATVGNTEHGRMRVWTSVFDAPISKLVEETCLEFGVVARMGSSGVKRSWCNDLEYRVRGQKLKA